MGERPEEIASRATYDGVGKAPLTFPPATRRNVEAHDHRARREPAQPERRVPRAGQLGDLRGALLAAAAAAKTDAVKRAAEIAAMDQKTVAELAAWTALSRVLFNLDDFINAVQNIDTFYRELAEHLPND